MTDLLERIRDRSARVIIAGQGYVGLPVAMRATDVGFTVVGYDVSAERVAALAAGTSFVGDVSAAQLLAGLAAGYTPTADPDDLADFDIAIISVPTPLRDGTPDLSHIEEAGKTLARYLRPGACVILESTTYPGTTTELLLPILERGSGLSSEQFHLGYSPERIDPGNTDFTLINTPKVTSGIDATSCDVVDAFFSVLVERTVPVGSTAEAELVKLLENTFRHVNIALVNELAMFARELDVDLWRAIDAASTKPFGFMKFTPGPGVGGHCLPVDPSYLAWRVNGHLGTPFRFIELANEVNEHMPHYVVARAAAMLNRERRSVNGSKVLLLGFSYKANTSDWRESPSAVIADLLAEAGAEVSVCDPHISASAGPPINHSMVDFEPSELAAADLVLLLVDHDEFDPNLVGEHAQLVLDTKNSLHEASFNGEAL